MSMENLRDVILSDEYLDFILPYYDGIEQDFSEYGIQFFNSHLVMIHSRRPSENLIKLSGNLMSCAIPPCPNFILCLTLSVWNLPAF